MKNQWVGTIGLILATIFFALSIPVEGKAENGMENYDSTPEPGESKSEKIRRLKLKFCGGDLDTLYGIYSRGEEILLAIRTLSEKAAYHGVPAGIGELSEGAAYETILFLRAVEDQVRATKKICEHIASGHRKSDLYYSEEGSKKSKSEIIGGLKLLLCGPDFRKLEITSNHTRKLIRNLETLLERISPFSFYAKSHSELSAVLNEMRIFYDAISYQIHATKKICSCIASGCGKSELIRGADIAIESEVPNPNLLLLVIWELYD